MRLLDVDSVSEDRLPVFHELLESGPDSPLRYAILSHTWGKRQDNEEIVFDDIPSSETFARFFDEATQLKQWRTAIDKKKKGFAKITNACKMARESGMGYIWIDSCCIDKSKSAELSESINSMYKWYQKSVLCIVYLEDLDPGGDLRQCRWFKRGWTLQELVAPAKASFYYDDWTSLGERSETGLCKSLANITGIDMDYLQGGVDLGALSIAHRMSWANGRETTVPEDRAYSLMGIFDVNMPLIYGEGGSKAFQRLQEEIVKSSSDLSIFAWDPTSPAHTVLDVFASTPNDFIEYKDMVPSYQSQHFTRTNKGIEMKTILWRISLFDEKERLMLPIGKQRNGKHDIGILLRKVGHNMYMRSGKMQSFLEHTSTSSTPTSTFYLVSPHASTGYDHFLNRSRERAIMITPEGLGDFRVENCAPQYAWDGEDELFFNNQHWGGSNWRALVLVKKGLASDRGLRVVALFGIGDPRPSCYLLRWREELAFLFDRRHQTKTTRLEEFRGMVEKATSEIDMEKNGAKMSLKLILHRCGNTFRLHLQELPRSHSRNSSSVDPPEERNPTVDIFSTSDGLKSGRTFEQTTASSDTKVKESNDAASCYSEGWEGFELRPSNRMQRKRVFSQFQIMEEPSPGSYAVMSRISAERFPSVLSVGDDSINTLPTILACDAESPGPEIP